jgi:hypothetical protein
VRVRRLLGKLTRIRLSEGSGVGRRQFYKAWTCPSGLPEATSRVTSQPLFLSVSAVLTPAGPGQIVGSNSPEFDEDGDMMQKPVRYYITESDDRPVVRTVSVAIRQEPDVDQRPVDAPTGNAELQTRNSRRSRLRDRLKTARHLDDNS